MATQPRVPMYALFLLFACTSVDPKESTPLEPVDSDGDGYTTEEDCDDEDAAVHPGAEELCDAVDNDCSGFVDDLPGAAYADDDGDGYGDPAAPTGLCRGVADNTDCNDTDAAIHPGAGESCAPGDEDCDRLEGDEDDDLIDATSGFADVDGDGYGDDATPVTGCEGFATQGGDCNDADATISPRQSERCDAFDVDEDCDGLVNGADTNTVGGSDWYRDRDEDGYGNPDEFVSACDAPAGYLADDQDCADRDADVHPGATETCDGVDEDCNGSVDDGATATTLVYRDTDGDGHGNPSYSGYYCASDLWASVADDCDDYQVLTYPGATEWCNGIDDDCSGTVDDNCTDVGDSANYDTGVMQVQFNGGLVAMAGQVQEGVHGFQGTWYHQGALDGLLCQYQGSLQDNGAAASGCPNCMWTYSTVVSGGGMEGDWCTDIGVTDTTYEGDRLDIGFAPDYYYSGFGYISNAMLLYLPEYASYGWFLFDFEYGSTYHVRGDAYGVGWTRTAASGATYYFYL
jgi:Putative metal-binding motif